MTTANKLYSLEVMKIFIDNPDKWFSPKNIIDIIHYGSRSNSTVSHYLTYAYRIGLLQRKLAMVKEGNGTPTPKNIYRLNYYAEQRKTDTENR